MQFLWSFSFAYLLWHIVSSSNLSCILCRLFLIMTVRVVIVSFLSLWPFSVFVSVIMSWAFGRVSLIASPSFHAYHFLIRQSLCSFGVCFSLLISFLSIQFSLVILKAFDIVIILKRYLSKAVCYSEFVTSIQFFSRHSLYQDEGKKWFSLLTCYFDILIFSLCWKQKQSSSSCYWNYCLIFPLFCFLKIFFTRFIWIVGTS